MSQTIDGNHLRKEVIKSRNLTLVQFRADWSGACHILSPVFEDLCSFYKGIANFFSIDVDEEAGVEKEFGVQEFPTILFFKNGELVDHVIGLTPKDTLISKIENALA